MSEKKIYIATIQIAVESEGEAGYCEDLLSAALTENLMGIGVIKDWQYALVFGKQSTWEPVEGCPVDEAYNEGDAFNFHTPKVSFDWDELAKVNKTVTDILVRKEGGQDCSEEESGTLKQYIMETYLNKPYDPINIDAVYRLVEAIAYYFPTEAGEAEEAIDSERAIF